jgi:tetratricopeptide (TPR) repeat protein
MGILVLLVRFPVPKVEALVLDQKLRQILQSPTGLVSDDSAEKVAHTLHGASDNGLTLPTETLNQIRDAIKASALKNPNSEALTDAARELQRYGREVKPGSPTKKRSAIPERQMQMEFDLGVQSLIHLSMGSSRQSPTDITQAIMHFSHVIDGSRNDVALTIRALSMRALAFNSAGQYEDALHDMGAAERLGAIDLTFSALNEAYALVHRGSPADLQRALGLCTVALTISPPETVAQSERTFSLRILANRAEAYYLLGRFNEAATDARRGLNNLNKETKDQFSEVFYRLIILAELGLDSRDDALLAATELAERTGDSVDWNAATIIMVDRTEPAEAVRRRILALWKWQAESFPPK